MAETLTAREAEVLALLAERLTNVEIAARLVVSVRTVESHVSALLRKLAVADRRELARLAPTAGARPTLPSPLTSFVGRVRELDALVDAVSRDRLVTATGPGGVGKTRLALAAAHRVSGDYPDGATFVDLVRIVDPAMVVAAVADAVGVPERAGTNREQALLAALAARDGVVVLDNCEHVVDGVRPCVERLLTGCPRLRVLATSRIRLMLPYESVFAVPGLSVDAGDAGALFAARMVAGGAPAPSGGDEEIIRGICRGLDGMALAIELAAARVPAIGLDGLLGADLPLLTAGYRAEHRHGSLRATIDWSYALLGPDERAALRAASVFAARFDAESLAAVLGWSRTATLDALGRLVDWNLVAPRRGAVTRYRMLETIRQYAADLSPDYREAHVRWARERLTSLLADAVGPAPRVAPTAAGAGEDGAAERSVWCAAVDAVLDDGRAALPWLGAQPGRGAEAARLAGLVAAVSFQRGRPGEAQLRYTQAADRADDPAERHRYLRYAAGAAAVRNLGSDAVDLLERAAAGAADPDAAAEDLALAAMYEHRCRGIMGRTVTAEQTEERLARARAVSAGGPRALAAIAMAEGWAPGATARSRQRTLRALELARAAGDPLLENMVLDQLIVVELADRDVAAALDAVRGRLPVLAGEPVDARTGFEFFDAAQMGSNLFLAAGDLAEARRHADLVAALPFYREEEHIGLARRIDVDALAGEFGAVVEAGERMERDWVRAGRPVASNLAVSAYSVAAVHGLLGDDDARRHWTGITTALLGAYPEVIRQRAGWVPVLDALVDLHRGDAAAAFARLAAEPEDGADWANANLVTWQAWYAALWAEASVLAGHPSAADRLPVARGVARTNPIALTIIDRSAALLRGDRAELPALAERFARAGCPYQRDRTYSLA
ncbi:ATP-binding protein, partial [Cryptosporangium arvum]|uniref:ATP-binding protein n=1 Tax=Cryptosporangium arvum TaxID=80871 RepID=UPI0004B5499E